MTPEQIKQEAFDFTIVNPEKSTQECYIAARTKTVEEKDAEIERLKREIEGQDYWPKLSEVEKENQSLQSQLAHYKALAEAADWILECVPIGEPFNNHYTGNFNEAIATYQSLKQKIVS